MRLSVGIATALLMIAAAGCESNGAAAPTTDPPPPYVGHVGAPIHAKAHDGATADITLNSLTWIPENCAGSWACIVADLTFTGTSPKPFKYHESHVIGGYVPSGSTPWADFRRGQYWGGDPMVDYSAIHKVPPLRVGSRTSLRSSTRTTSTTSRRAGSRTSHRPGAAS
jgi:hypothetical protein